jgi:hypothetical protein
MASRLGADARRTAAAYDSGRLDVKA